MGLLQRLMTAIVFVAIMMAGIYWNVYTFLGLLGLIVALSLWEFSGIVLEEEATISRKVLSLVIGLFAFGGIAIASIDVAIPLYAYALFPAFLFLIFLFELFSVSKRPFQNIAFMLMGLVYIALPFSLLVDLTVVKAMYNPNIILGLLLLVWASDTGAYLVGSMVGKTPLFPRISPNKTWEGTIGGWVLSLLVGVALFYIFGIFVLWKWLVLAAICGVFGTLGDLVESMLKRSFGIKDSGSLLPGHGGILDRFDAFLFVLPFVYAFLKIF